MWHYPNMNTNNNSILPIEAMREAIQNIAVGPDRGRNISRGMASIVMGGILAGEISDIQVAVFLIALRMKRESIPEFLGLYDALKGASLSIEASVDEVIVLADPFDGYVRNVTMTPFIPAVLAACGHHAIIHGVETVGPKHGVTTHKVIKTAGGNPLKSVACVAGELSNFKWGYVDQSQYAPSLFALRELRDSIVKRTALTTLERLLMPIRGKQASHLALGYVHKAYPEIYATVAKSAGYDSVLLLKGVEGGLAPALNKPLRRFFFDQALPDDINSEKQLIETQSIFSASSAAQVSTEADQVAECVSLGLEVLAGINAKTTILARNSLCLAAGQILNEHESNLSLAQAVEKVEACLDNGSAKARFDDFLGC